MKDNELVDAKQAGEICGRSAKTITLWVKSGKLTPAFKGKGLRGMYLFTTDAVRAALADSETPTK